MNNLTKIILLSLGMSGCASKINSKDTYFSVNSFEEKLVTLYRDIKDEAYIKGVYAENLPSDMHLDIRKLHGEYPMSYELFNEYISSLDSETSYEDYVKKLEGRNSQIALRNEGKVYQPPKVLRKTRVEDITGKRKAKRNSFGNPLLDRFYTMFKKGNDLVEFKIEFRAGKKDEKTDSYENKVLIYLYKNRDGKEFIIDPDILISTNF